MTENDKDTITATELATIRDRSLAKQLELFLTQWTKDYPEEAKKIAALMEQAKLDLLVYGRIHPSTQKAVADFMEHLKT